MEIVSIISYRSAEHKLQSKQDFSTWSKNRLNDLDAIKSEDYQDAKILSPSGQSRKEHIIKLDIAKEMAMLERNDRGKQVRRYFIQVEKKYKEIKEVAQESGKSLVVALT